MTQDTFVLFNKEETLFVMGVTREGAWFINPRLQKLAYSVFTEHQGVKLNESR